MSTVEATSLNSLYEQDETAWLDAMVALLRSGAYSELDYPHFIEFLRDTARRDRREVRSRLTVLIAHVLKWDHQPDRRSRSGRASIIGQRQELLELAGSGVLRNHAESVLSDTYQDAVERAAADTGLADDAFPVECPYSLDEVLSFDPVYAED